jgi:hypothetical protein
MGDAGEGLIDADSRIQERLEDLERERDERRGPAAVKNPERAREVESLRLARIELKRQLDTTTHDRRRTMLTQALTELDKRIADAEKKLE